MTHSLSPGPSGRSTWGRVAAATIGSEMARWPSRGPQPANPGSPPLLAPGGRSLERSQCVESCQLNRCPFHRDPLGFCCVCNGASQPLSSSPQHPCIRYPDPPPPIPLPCPEQQCLFAAGSPIIISVKCQTAVERYKQLMSCGYQ